MPVPSAARKVSSVPGVPLSSVAVPVPELQTQVIYGPRVKAAGLERSLLGGGVWAEEEKPSFVRQDFWKK